MLSMSVLVYQPEHTFDNAIALILDKLYFCTMQLASNGHGDRVLIL